MSELPACQVCGCTSYTKVSGYFVCSNCDTQSQEIEEQLFEYDDAQGRINDDEREEIVTKSVADRELTSWEWYNLVLKGLVQEFIQLGASPQLKIVAFQLWASYLQKANAAFFSKQTNKLPFLPLGFKTSDAKILYGIPNLRKSLFKEVMFRKDLNIKKAPQEKDGDSEMEVSGSSSPSSLSSISLQSLRHKQRKLALSELNESSLTNETVLSQNDSLLTLGSDKKNKSKKHTKVFFKSATQHALKHLIHTVKKTKEIDDNDNKKRIRNLVVRRLGDSKRNGIVEGNMMVTKATLISVIRTALLLMGEEILLGDILRWSSEGHISMNQPEKFIPKTSKAREGRTDVLQCNRNGYEIDIKNFTQILNIPTIPTPNLYKLLERYCNDLCLPSEFVAYVHGIMNFFQPKMTYSDYDFRTFPNFECRVLAYILLSFKLLFSLDGLTERKQSAFADYINKNRTCSEKVPLLFSWNGWVRYIECRKALLSKYDPVMNAYAYNGRTDNNDVFEKYWDKMKPIYSVHKDLINPIFISTTEKVFEKITSEETQPNIEFPPSLTPHLDHLNHLLSNYPQLIPEASRTILEDNFKHHSMRFLINEECCRQIGEACNVQVEFVEGIAEVDMEPFETPKSAVPVVSKTTVIPAYVATPVDVISEPPRTTKGKTKYDRCKKYHFEHETFAEHQPPSVKEAFKIYNPSKEYWFFHECHRGISNENFSELAQTNFSDSFHWLLRELAYLVRSDIKELYLELMVIESVLYSLFVESEYASHCSVNLYSNEW